MPTTTAVRTARWHEYVPLACLVARRLAPARGRPTLALAVRRSCLFVGALGTFAGFGALTVGQRQAVASAWALDKNRRGMIRASPLLATMGALELALFALSPDWVPVAVGIIVAGGLALLVPRRRAQAELRTHRRREAIFVSNFASRLPGAGRKILDELCAQADGQGRYLCLEAVAVPRLLHYYGGVGFKVASPPALVGSRELVYMERPPTNRPLERAARAKGRPRLTARESPSA